MPLAFGLSMLMSLAVGNTASAATIPIVAYIPQAQTVQEYVDTYFVDIPVMVDIAECESHFRQYNTNGSVYHGEVNHADIGVMQINTAYHAAEARALGYDLNSIEGNVAFARYLYETKGTAPWASSEKCWGASQPLAVK